MRYFQKNMPKMSKCTQKHAQIAFCSKLKQQKCHTIWKKSNPLNRICKNQGKQQTTFKQNKLKNKQPATPQKTQAKIRGKPQGWQHWQTIFVFESTWLRARSTRESVGGRKPFIFQIFLSKCQWSGSNGVMIEILFVTCTFVWQWRNYIIL